MEPQLKGFKMTNDDEKARNVTEEMLKTDYFSHWLGVIVLEIKFGYSKIQMVVRKEMLNGFGIAHGGIAFSFADSAFAFACNSDGRTTVALDVSISFTKPAKENDILTAKAKQL